MKPKKGRERIAEFERDLQRMCDEYANTSPAQHSTPTTTKVHAEENASDTFSEGSSKDKSVTGAENLADRDWAPSEAWRQAVFSSSARIDIKKNGKSTTRHPVTVGWAAREEYVSGGHERVAALLIEALWAAGYVRRWKPQPFNLLEIGGPDITPDFLCEIYDRTLQVIETKPKRFVTPDVQEKFDLEKEVLTSKSMNFLIWTNADVLSSATSHTVAELERGRRFAASAETIREIGTKAGECQTLGQLLALYSWDDVLSAAAHQAFHINFTSQLHENTRILRNYSHINYDYLFARRDASTGWWNSLGASPN